MTEGRIEILTTETFDTSVSGGTAVVEFGAPWCMPCRMMEPVLRQLAHTFAGRVRVMSVDTDRQQALAKRFEVRAVPTVLILREGQVIHRLVGLISFDRLVQAIETPGHTPGEAHSGTAG